MAKVIITEQYLSDIADAIRAKLGVSDTYTPAQMAGAIGNIGGEGEEVIFDDRNQYVTGFLTASDGYSAANRSSLSVIGNWASRSISDQDAPKPFLGTYNLMPYIANAVGNWTVTRLPEPPHMLKLENAWNVRDIGGWACDGGTVKFGKVFRGSRLNNVSSSSADATALAGFGIKLDLDIRDKGNATGSTPIPNCSYRSEPIVNAYAQMLSSEPAAAAAACQAAMQSVVDGNPVYIHCASGSDRTGCICAMLEALLGVSDRDIDRDYELTNFSDYEDLTGRRRDGGSWTGFMSALNAYGAANVKMNVAAFLRSQGVTVALMNAFRVAAIDGTPSDITVTTHTVTNTLTHCTTSNHATSVDEGASYTATISADSGYTLSTVTVTMGGTDITATAYSGGVVSIASVTGNVTIMATATSQASYTNIIDTYGYTDGKYISSGNLSTNSADTTIGKIPLTALPRGSVLYIKGYTGAAGASHTRINISSSASYNGNHISEKNGWLASPINPLTVETLGTGYYKVTVGGNWSGYYANATHLGLCFAGTKGADLIITVNEPIE